METLELHVDLCLSDQPAYLAMTALAEAMTHEAPCDDCALRSLCADGLLACEAFNAFVNAPRHKAGTAWHGKDRYPSRAIYRAVMSNAPSPKRASAVLTARRAA